MRAAYIERYGGPEVLRLGELPAPAPGPGDLLIEVRAASVNPVDFKIRGGLTKLILPYRFPLILGNDCSGVVKAVGAAVTRFRPGDAVYARLDKNRIGAFAEYAVVAESSVAAKPASLNFEEAAAIPLAGLTAWQALVEFAQIKPGQKVLIHAGAGGVGSLAIQIAKHCGAFVATTVGTRNVALARELGADLAIDYRTQRFEDFVRDYDMVFSTLAGDVLRRSFAVLRRGGVLVDIAGLPTAAFARRWGLNTLLVLALGWMTRKETALARRHGVRYEYLFMTASGAQLDRLSALIDAGAIRPVIDRVFPFGQVREAIAHVEAGHATGKVVVSMA